MPERPEPRNLQCEPRYPGLHTVCLSIRFPDWTIHRKSKRCPVEEAHLIAECGEFQDASVRRKLSQARRRNQRQGQKV